MVSSRQRPDIHYANLKPWHRNTVCAELAKEDVRAFVLVSNKKNMHAYRNKKAEAVSLHPNNWFYNYCIRILIERVSDWVERRSILDFKSPQKLKLVFSKRGGHSYRHVETYTELLSIQAQKGTLYQSIRAPKFSVIDHKLIEVVQHSRLAGLQMADIVASAFYNAANTSNLKHWDTAPAMALMPRVASTGNHIKIYKNVGLTLLPWHPQHAGLSSEQKAIFEHYGYKL